MAEWYQKDPMRFIRDLETMNRLQPGLFIRTVKVGFPVNLRYMLPHNGLVAYGPYMLSLPDMEKSYGFRVCLIFPDSYPETHPKLYVCDHRLPMCNYDQHIFGSGQACLGSPGEIISRWDRSPDLELFLTEVVNSWVVWQICHAAGLPDLPARSHGAGGIYEYYQEYLGSLEFSDIHKFIVLLGENRLPPGSKLCPCGSGKLFKHCHEQKVNRLKKDVSPAGLIYDLRLLESVA